jgi:hypothetical protein
MSVENSEHVESSNKARGQYRLDFGSRQHTRRSRWGRNTRHTHNHKEDRSSSMKTVVTSEDDALENKMVPEKTMEEDTQDPEIAASPLPQTLIAAVSAYDDTHASAATAAPEDSSPRPVVVSDHTAATAPTDADAADLQEPPPSTEGVADGEPTTSVNEVASTFPQRVRSKLISQFSLGTETVEIPCRSWPN